MCFRVEAEVNFHRGYDIRQTAEDLTKHSIDVAVVGDWVALGVDVSDLGDISGDSWDVDDDTGAEDAVVSEEGNASKELGAEAGGED